jgi:hypothetical protein
MTQPISSFFSSVVERGIAAMQVILRSLFRSREEADSFASVQVIIRYPCALSSFAQMFIFLWADLVQTRDETIHRRILGSTRPDLRGRGAGILNF